ncbi:methyltransferase domain-containing protein [Streptosporangium sp. NPDC004631]
MDWEAFAARLAESVTGRDSSWREPVASVPRHRFVPSWWDTPDGVPFGQWMSWAGPRDEEAWLAATYADQTLVTQVDGHHADHTEPGATCEGLPTSSSTLPSLVVRILGYGDVYPGADVLDVATGSGYSAALLCHRLGDHHVSSLDVDPYLVDAAAERLAAIGYRPTMLPLDARKELPGSFDRIVSMVGIRPVPPSWLEALRPGGRLVTVIAGTSLILTATKNERGVAVGRIEWERAMFMPTRAGAGRYPPRPDRPPQADGEGETVALSPYPVVFPSESWDLAAMLEITEPGIQHDFTEGDSGERAAYLWHQDGSWARATSLPEGGSAIHQGGKRRLWDLVDDIRRHWLEHGELPVRGARAVVRPDGRVTLTRGGWKAVIQ